MMNQQLLDYVRQSLQSGASKESISSALLSQGWQQQDIDETFSAASAPVPAPPAQNEQLSSGEARPLVSIGKLFGQTWEMYKKHLGVFLGIVFLPILAAAIFVIALGIMTVYAAGAAASGSWGQILPILLLLVAISLVFALAQGWSQVALIFVLANDQERLGIFGAYRRGWHFILSYWWIALLTGFIVAGGFFLLIIPGLIFILWFVFAPFILVAENVRGMDALLKSREYVRGKWGSVFLRFLCVFAPFIAASVAINAFLGSSTVASQIGNLALALFLTPFLTTYLFLLYTNLRESKGNFIFNPTRGQKAKFILVGFASIVVILVLGVVLIVRTNNRSIALNPTNTATTQTADERDMKRIGDIISMRTDLSTYYAAHQKYPSASAASTCEPVSDNLTNALSKTFDDPTPGQNYMYAVDSTANPQRYVLAATLENSKNSIYANSSYTDHPWQGTFLGCNCTGSTYCFLPY